MCDTESIGGLKHKSPTNPNDGQIALSGTISKYCIPYTIVHGTWYTCVLYIKI